jgi:succinate dehydrogenase / fumarate reductase cytochrome b subunit
VIAKIAFLVALSAVIVAIGWFAVAMARVARRADGGAYPTRRVLQRMLRLPSERSEANRWAYYAHRFTGVAVFGFLVLHIGDVSLYTFNQHTYADVHSLYGTWPLRIFECGLLFAVLFHTLNGLRLVAVDIADVGIVGARRMLGAVTTATVVLGVLGSIVILEPIFT